ncbi:MAG: hypothetical protein JSR33_13850 [Proteobacteria bacterium]|nr:hypothetical protein [Pseudomonadota bacterium]
MNLRSNCTVWQDFSGLVFWLKITYCSELMAFKITQENCSDSQEATFLLRKLEGLAFGDKDYISKKLFDTLFSQGLKLIT